MIVHPHRWTARSAAVFAPRLFTMLALLAGLLSVSATAVAQPRQDGALIARGRYLALAGDCTACHTIDPAKQMAGGEAVPTPFGAIYTANITPDRATGIGSWSDDDFLSAMQRGVGKHGEHLYPAFPYASFTLLSREDTLAIKAYLFSLPPIQNVIPTNHLSFPFNQRWILWGWKLFNLHDARFQPDLTKSADWNRGAYLVDALEHCGTCHTPRNLTMGLEQGQKLGGGAAGAWSAYNITPDKVGGIGGWSDEDVQSYLSTGIAPGKARAAGPMAEAVEHSLSQLNQDDIRAIVTYVREQKPVSEGRAHEPRFTFGKPASYEAGLRGASGLTDSRTSASGEELFSANCASCHGARGTGSTDGYFPSLLHNTAVGAPAANNLVMVILNGVHRRTPHGNAFMPGFSGLGDDEVVSLANYVETQFGDPAARVTMDRVVSSRTNSGQSPPYLWIAIGITASSIVLLVAVLLALRRRRTFSGAVRH